MLPNWDILKYQCKLEVHGKLVGTCKCWCNSKGIKLAGERVDAIKTFKITWTCWQMLEQALNTPHLKMRLKGTTSITLKGTKSSHSFISIGTVSYYDEVRAQEESFWLKMLSTGIANAIKCNRHSAISSKCNRLTAAIVSHWLLHPISSPHSGLSSRQSELLLPSARKSAFCSNSPSEFIKNSSKPLLKPLYIAMNTVTNDIST